MLVRCCIRRLRFAPATMAQRRHGSEKQKIVTAEDAVHLIESGSTITVGGFVGQGAPEEILYHLGQRFLETGSPTNLTLVFGGGPGDWDTKGINHIAYPGLLRRSIGAHYGQTPRLAKLAQNNEIEAYNLPLGAISRMIRCAASGSPGHITEVGFGTFVDPKLTGGKINERTTEDLVIEIHIEGKRYLLYKSVPIDVALVRGTTGDQHGNISMERESLYVDHLIQAMSARATRGFVLAQVERQAAVNSLHPRSVKIPGTLVDAVVVAKPENHNMSYITNYNPAAAGTIREPPRLGVTPLSARKVIARRAALDLMPNQVVNLGIGMPEGIADVAAEEGILSSIELTTEPGIHGGVGLSGHDFGPAVNYDALLEMNQQFDFYNGGGLDAAFLGMAEVDAYGNVNVTRVGPTLTGPGGFVDISQCTKKVTLMGTFTAGGLKCSFEDGRLVILKEGKNRKFVKNVREITFSGAEAVRRDQEIKYVTERCVFTLAKEGLVLSEVAPGIDIQTQILDLMDFAPIVPAEGVPLMQERLFGNKLMALAISSLDHSLKSRISYTPETNTVFVNLANITVASLASIEAIEQQISGFYEKNLPGKRAHHVVSYDGFDIVQVLSQEWKLMTDRLHSKYFDSVRRYSGRAFQRYRLGLDINMIRGQPDDMHLI